MNSVLKRTLLSSLVVPFALGAQSASAALITDWGYDVSNSFSNVGQTAGSGGVSSTSEGGVSTLSWGVGAGPQSSVSINNVSAPNGLLTNVNSVMGGTFTHTNNPLPAEGAALSSFDLTSTLMLTSFAPEAGLTPDPISLTFQSFFNETLNSAGNCVDASASVCDDIFTVGNIEDLGATETLEGFEFAAPSFTIDDFSYTVYLELAGLTTLDNDACAAAGAPNGCVGLLTEEGAVNDFETRFRITATQVPEPGTLALLGLGLAGLGLSRRKQAAKA